MGYDFLSKIHVIGRVDSLSYNIASNPDVFYSFSFSSPIEAGDCLRFLYQHSISQSFTITLLCEEFVDDEALIGNLLHILSHPNYLKEQNKKIIWVDGAADLKKKRFIDKISDGLVKQGCLDLVFNAVENIVSVGEGDGEQEEQVFNNWYSDLLSSRPESLHICTYYKDDRSLKSLIELRIRAEIFMKSKRGVAYYLIKQLQEKQNEISENQLVIKNISNDLATKNEYLSFLLGKFIETEQETIGLNSSMQIRKFYHWEYEILPSWYKKIGHIIKVLMGKRTFRSLFNDNVKKYKD
jgi:hypothetical protein